MSFRRLFRIDLRRLIISLAVISSLIALVNTFHASYRVQREQLISNTLEANRVYAAKLSESTDNFLKAAQQQLAFSASVLSENLGNEQQLLSEARRLQQQTDSFNSVVIVNAQGRVLTTSPTTLQLQGEYLNSPGAREALNSKKPTISQVYISTAGNLVVNISQPILSGDGKYLGYVSGSIYLKERSILHTLLGEHYYRDGSYLYVVDRNGRLLYHTDPSRVGTIVQENSAISAVMLGKSGAERVLNSKGVDMLAGYAPLPRSGWAVIAQRPTAATLAPLDGLMLDVLRHTVPLAALSLLGIWWLARLISKPLWQLASNAEHFDSNIAAEKILQVQSWYFEATQLKRAMLSGLTLVQERIGKLNLASLTDPMTGLYNRRGLETTLDRWKEKNRSFSIIALDIDRFKKVNDTYGHDAGDRVIMNIASMMKKCSRSADILCRSGGEEFLMLLPDTEIANAGEVAERLRLQTAQCETSGVGYVTISLGIASWPESSPDMGQALKLADTALYAAKEQGRNRVVAYSPDSSSGAAVQSKTSSAAVLPPKD
ncbi:sensor domain-containing diguanylate cyclase [Cupriavidus sp. SK-3]|uniref:sensor domain-containing diguanylate cyclase n=1 Tax=Cupriavidus sp. SK-3 TaxID=1470558 RepID=UPI00068B5052|nr:sensor domain-containing diguanylate cyclase [Cupriavidus sp. SK-3]